MRISNIISLSMAFMLLGTATLLFSSEIDRETVREELGFKICQIRIHHQDLWRTLHIKVWYQFEENGDQKAIADTTVVKKKLVQFLADFPNQSDFWEILNTKMAHHLLESYPFMTSLEIEIGVKADETVPVQRRSIIRYQNGQLDELFGFKYTPSNNNQNFLHSSVLNITYKYKENIDASEYPDFLWLCDAIDKYLASKSIESWEETKPKLMKHLMNKFPMVTCVDIVVTNG